MPRKPAANLSGRQPLDVDLAAILDAAQILDDGREIPDNHDALSIWAPRFCEHIEDAVARGLLTFRSSGLMSLTDAGRAARSLAA